MLSSGVGLLEKVMFNASFLVFFGFVFAMLCPWITRFRDGVRKGIWGLLYGLTALIMMHYPLISWDGGSLGATELVLGLSGVLYGTVPGIVSLVVTEAGLWLFGEPASLAEYGAGITAACTGLLAFHAGKRYPLSFARYTFLGLLLSIEVLLWNWNRLDEGSFANILADAVVPVILLYTFILMLVRFYLFSQRRKGSMEQKLHEREHQYRMLAEHSQDLIFNCDLQGRLISANPKFMQATGLSQEELSQKSLNELLLVRSELSDWEEMLSQLIQTQTSISAEKEIVNGQDGSRIYVTTLSPVIGADGQMKSAIGTCYDITSVRKSEQHIRQLSYFDTLTELPNRKLLTERLHQATLNGDEMMHALVLIDLDNFKFVNDTRGYAFGDELLKAVGNQLQQLFSPQYTVAKMGEDEYAVLLEDMDQIQPLLSCIETVQEQFQFPLFIRGEPIHSRISMGVAVYPGDGKNAEDLIRNAGTAIYKAKKTGKNQCCFYNADMRESLLRRSKLEDSLRKALIHNEFILQFQPQCHATTESVRGFEALIRWVHPELGTISPAEFIPIAEETGVIVPIGEWVIRTACERIKAIQKYHFEHAIISVNVSPVQLKRHDFVDMVMNILRETHVEPHHLELEITESIMMESFHESVHALEQLRGHGIRIALDDFGTGYSSLSYLRLLPIETLKIDRSFIQDIVNEPMQAALTESIIHLVHKMGIQVVAEGVETEEQLKFLQAWGCEYIQGYLVSEPLYELEIRRLSYLPQWRDPA
ncbi:putative bifunctional diguanylate cyclase/phosphodiesterase [Paenibacillus rigui]|uniref:PAS domain S-box protein n=1 Tax=Paenibacillus rigui TaxID=554312 RepID=A0A229ULP6_9BACL|nr:GGDEF domain-containing phosphodiesterase [Paenibacillus rigui]OXM84378.1 hypothetical protein CF651_21615 [Paenibacillus rigui]